MPFEELLIATCGPTEPRGGSHQDRIVGPISQPRGTIYTTSRTLDHTYALCALSEPTLIKAAKRVLYPYVGGTATHRARNFCDLLEATLSMSNAARSNLITSN